MNVTTGLNALLNAQLVRAAALDALAVVAPTDCSGCGAPDRGLCAACELAVAGAPRLVDAGGEPSLPVRCALAYRGVVRQVLIAYKELGRTDAAPALSRALETALRSVIHDVAGSGAIGSTANGAGRIELATIPSTRTAFRARGYHPTELLLSHAGLRAAGVLRPARQTEDQATLGADARRVNRSGSLSARTSLHDRMFIVVDDIVTTGSTLLEARRAIVAAGGRVCGAAAVAHTARELSPR